MSAYKTTIHRMTEHELELAIADLIKRGYDLVKRGETVKTSKSYSYRTSSYQPKKYNGMYMDKQYWAVLRREE